MIARSLLTGFAVLAALAGARAQDAKIDFVRDIQPILEFHCVSCHNADEAKADLRFDKASHFMKGGGWTFRSGFPFSFRNPFPTQGQNSGGFRTGAGALKFMVKCL